MIQKAGEAKMTKPITNKIFNKIQSDFLYCSNKKCIKFISNIIDLGNLNARIKKIIYKTRACLNIKSPIFQLLKFEYIPGCESVVIKFDMPESPYPKPLFFNLPYPFVMCNFNPVENEKIEKIELPEGISLNDAPSAGIEDSNGDRRLYFGMIDTIDRSDTVNKKLTTDDIRVEDVHCIVGKSTKVLNIINSEGLLPVYVPGILAIRYCKYEHMDSVLDLVLEDCKDDVITIGLQNLGYRDNTNIDNRTVSDSLLFLISFGKAMADLTEQDISFSGIVNYDNNFTADQEYKIIKINITKNNGKPNIQILCKDFGPKAYSEMVYYGTVKIYPNVQELPDDGQVGRKLHELVKPKIINCD